MAENAATTHKIDIAKEVKQLQRDKQALEERVKRRDGRINYLSEKFARLEHENNRLYKRLDIERDNHIDPEFRWISTYHDDYKNILDDPPGQNGVSSLAGLVKVPNFVPPSIVQPTILHARHWYLSSVESTMLRPNGRYIARIRAIENGKDTSDVDDRERRDMEESTRVDSIAPRGQGGAASAKTDGGTKEDQSGENESTRPGSQEPGRAIPTQPKCFRPDEEMMDKMEHTITNTEPRGMKRRRSSNANPSMPIQRKSVCVRCWKIRALCDFYPQCGNCLVAKVKCVRKLCHVGARCFNRRCPYLHPGEWNETDPEYIVEGGGLPVPGEDHRDKKARLALADCYRPGDYDGKR